MIVNTEEAVLKGQYNLAQGKQSWRMGVKIVRAITFLGGLSFFRTKRHESQFRPKEVFALIIVFARMVFSLSLLPQTLSGARISWPFRPKLVYKE